MSNRKTSARPWRIKVDQPDGSAHTISDCSGRYVDHVVNADFDEVVVGGWLHCERMDQNEWWIRVGNAVFGVSVHNGKARVRLTEGTVGADGIIKGGRE